MSCKHGLDCCSECGPFAHTPAPQTPMEAAMTVPTASALATGKTRTHRMMRRPEQIRRKREHTRRADEAAAALISLPFWRWRRRARLEDLEAHHRERAWHYAETLGEVQAGEVG